MQAGVTSAQLPGPMHMLLNITQCLKWRLSGFFVSVQGHDTRAREICHQL